MRRAVTFIIGQGQEAVVEEIGFTPRAVAATTLAFNELGDLGQEKIAPEHLLLGLAKEGESIAAGLMRAFGTTLEKVYGTVAEIRRLRVVAQSLAQEGSQNRRRGNLKRKECDFFPGHSKRIGR